MKRLFRVSLAGVITCIILITSLLCVFAEGVSAVNGANAPVGSKVEYTLNLESYKQDVVGIQMFYKFDPKHLELKEATFENFPGATVNPNLNGDGMIYMNFTNVTEPVNFSTPKALGKLEFEVIAEGDSDIEYYIQYIYDYDMVSIYDYTLSYTLTVDGKSEVDNKTPLLADINNVLNEIDDKSLDKGEFANNVEGTGSGIKPPVTTINKEAIADKSDVKSDNGSDNTMIFVIIGVVIVALLAVVISAMLKKKKAQN